MTFALTAFLVLFGVGMFAYVVWDGRRLARLAGEEMERRERQREALRREESDYADRANRAAISVENRNGRAG